MTQDELQASNAQLLEACKAALQRFDEGIRGQKPSMNWKDYTKLLRDAIATAQR